MVLDCYTLCSDETKKRLEKGRTILTTRRDVAVERKRNAKKDDMEVLCHTRTSPKGQGFFFA